MKRVYFYVTGLEQKGALSHCSQFCCLLVYLEASSVLICLPRRDPGGVLPLPKAERGRNLMTWSHCTGRVSGLTCTSSASGFYGATPCSQTSSSSSTFESRLFWPVSLDLWPPDPLSQFQNSSHAFAPLGPTEPSCG